ncbi:hypothetical protein [Buttiauxella gaviniae]|uniref:hypothetical protein n=1 Tax=Buttiauxella gaviniae TaxID=82990 RepID=UPI0039B09F3B
MNIKNEFFNIDTDIKKPGAKKHKQIEDMDFALLKSKGEFFKEQREDKSFSFELSTLPGDGKIFSSGVIHNNIGNDKNTHITNIRIPLNVFNELKTITTGNMTKDVIALIAWSVLEIQHKSIDIFAKFNDKKEYRGNETVDKISVDITTNPGLGKVFSVGVITKDTKTEKLNHYTNLRFPIDLWEELKKVCTTNITKDIIALMVWSINEVKNNKVNIIAQFNDKKSWKGE